MATFDGQLWLAAEPNQVVEASLDIDGGVIRVESAGSVIGEWERGDITVKERPDGYHIVAEGEELVFRPSTPRLAGAMVQAMGTTASPLASRIRSVSSGESAPTPPQFQAPSASGPQPANTNNGMAVAALVLGIVGAVIGLIPLFGLFALIAGLLAIVFGVVGRRRVKSGETAGGKKMASWGLGLGVVAVLLGVIGLFIVGNAFTQLDQDLTDLQDDLENLGNISDVSIELDSCTSDGATGSVINNHDTSVDVSIEVFFYDGAGTQVDSSFAFVNGVRPGGRATWDAPIFGTDYETCEASISSAFE